MKFKIILFSLISGLLCGYLFNPDLIKSDFPVLFFPGILYGIAVALATKTDKDTFIRKLLFIAASILLYIAMVFLSGASNRIAPGVGLDLYVPSILGAVSFISLFHAILYKVTRLFISLLVALIIIIPVDFFLVLSAGESLPMSFILFATWQTAVGIALAVGAKSPSTK